MNDTGSKPGNDNTEAHETGGFAADIVMALRFFSRLPTGSRPHERPDLSRIAMALPFASILIGLVPAALLFGLVRAGVPPLFAAFLAAAVFAIVTGAMSEDAAADAADGLFGGTTPEKRLEIMKDSRHGSYGVLAIVFVVGLKVAALAAIAARNPLAAAMVWVAATMLARSGALYLALVLPPARASGVSATAGQVSRNGFAIGLVFASVIAIAMAAPFTSLLGLVFALALAAAIVWGWTALCRKLAGGQTGDLIGALQALLEIALLGAFMRMIAG